MRRRHRKNRRLGEFSPSAALASWVARGEFTHQDQSGVATSLSEIAERFGLHSFGFGSENEWFFILLPTRSTRPKPVSVASSVHDVLARRPEVAHFQVRQFEWPRDAQRAYDALLLDFDARHPD